MVVRNQMSEYFETHNLLPQTQHGFRKNRSTTSALLAVMGKIATMRQRGFEVAMASYDLSAAFDCDLWPREGYISSDAIRAAEK